MKTEWLLALLGGAAIGVSVSLMLLWNGRVTGISGIINGTLSSTKHDVGWRWYFIGGLVAGGVLLKWSHPQAFMGQLNTPLWTVIVAGLLVGFGTILGSGCTSGHGVCGISRLSPRSIVATCIFIGAGVLMVATLRFWGVAL